MLDLLLFKLELLDELLINQADKCGLSGETKNKLRAVFESHETFRACLGDEADMTWMSTLPPSAKEFIALVGVGWPNPPPYLWSVGQSIMTCLPWSFSD
jgi:hypothetical protein